MNTSSAVSMSIGVILSISAMLAVQGCKRVTHKSPQQLRDTYVETLSANDPKAAYDMLAPEIRATTSYEDFSARWKADAAERASLVKAANEVDPTLQVGMEGGSTVHEGGRVLTWVELDGRYYVVDGLPGKAGTATPAQTVRALIAAVNVADLDSIAVLLDDDLAEALAQDWQARAQAIEAALDKPGSIELSPDLRQAELHYDTGKALTLVQTPTGWRVTSLE